MLEREPLEMNVRLLGGQLADDTERQGDRQTDEFLPSSPAFGVEICVHFYFSPGSKVMPLHTRVKGFRAGKAQASHRNYCLSTLKIIRNLRKFVRD